MPFRSQAQQRFMYAQHPGIARRWTEEMREGKKGQARQHPIKAAGLPQKVGKAASSGTFERGGSTVMPMAQRPVRRGHVGQDRRGRGGNVRGTRLAKGMPFTPTPVLLQRGQQPSQAMNAGGGATMGTLAGQRTGNPMMSAGASAPAGQAQAVNGQIKAKPAQVGSAVQQKPAGKLVAATPQKPVSKAETASEARLRRATPYHGRRPRVYDPEARRQRGHGAVATALGLGGGVATGTGVRQVMRRSKRVKGAIAIDRKAATRLGLGAAGLEGAYLVHRRANDPRRRPWT